MCPRAAVPPVLLIPSHPPIQGSSLTSGSWLLSSLTTLKNWWTFRISFNSYGLPPSNGICILTRGKPLMWLNQKEWRPWRKSPIKKDKRKNWGKEALGMAEGAFQDWLPPSSLCTSTKVVGMGPGARWPQFMHLILPLRSSVNLDRSLSSLASVHSSIKWV